MGASYFKGLFQKLIPTGGIEFADNRIKTQGSGSPEGVITAIVGSEYTDTATGYLYLKLTGSGNTGWNAIPTNATSNPTGTVIMYMKTTVSGYLACEGQAVSRSTYSDLFAVMPNDSSTVTFTIDGSPTIMTWASSPVTTGQQIQFSTTGSLPTGLTAGTVYYVRLFSTNSYYLFTTLSDAMGTATGIVTSGSQSGTHTATTYFYGNGDGSTTFNVPDFQGLVPRGIGQTSGFPTFNPTIGIGEITNDQLQRHLFLPSSNTGFLTGTGSQILLTPGSGTYEAANNTGTTGGMTTDTVYGTPRAGYETRGKSLGIYFLIKT